MQKQQNSWQRQLSEFKEVLESQGTVTTELYHQALLIPSTASGQLNPNKLDMGGGGRTLLWRSPPLVWEGMEEHHFVFGDKLETWEAFQSCVDGHEPQWSQIPTEIVPRFKPLRKIKRADSNVVRWFRAILFLTVEFPGRLLNFEWMCGFCDDLPSIKFRPLHTAALPPDFNIRPLFFQPEKAAKYLADYQREHSPDDPLPNAFTAFWDKSLYYISGNAISCDREQSTLGGTAVQFRERGRRPKQAVDREIESIKGLLYDHHVTERKKTALLRDEIAEQLPELFTIVNKKTGKSRLNGIKVGRRMQTIFSASEVGKIGRIGIKAYAWLCEHEKIKKFLQKDRDELSGRGPQVKDMDQFADKA